MAAGVVFTIGHSIHSFEEFRNLLLGHGVARVADVRSIPKSRHVPQFNRDVLAPSLAASGVGYTHLGALGGRRHARKDSVNMAWRNASFRGYADYMATPQFADGLAELMRMAGAETTTIMCAEAVPWRCHRSLIADALLMRGWEVRDILSPAPATVHKATPFLRVIDGRLTYPADADSPLLFAGQNAADERA
jgi:uncharacterized protein (DUF488 family)